MSIYRYTSMRVKSPCKLPEAIPSLMRNRFEGAHMKRLLISLVALAALAAPSAALANGVVLKVQRATHLVAVTRAGSTNVALVHTSAAARLHVGQRVALSARRLHNGTLAASAVHVVGRAHTVRFRGLLLA